MTRPFPCTGRMKLEDFFGFIDFSKTIDYLKLSLSLRCCSYGSELSRLGGLARLGEISPFLRNSLKKLTVFI